MGCAQLVLSSGKVAVQRKPVVVLTLHTTDADGNEKTTLLELTETQLDDMLHRFAEVNGVLAQVVA